jgi:hypothetical protein
LLFSVEVGVPSLRKELPGWEREHSSDRKEHKNDRGEGDHDDTNASYLLAVLTIRVLVVL